MLCWRRSRKEKGYAWMMGKVTEVDLAGLQLLCAAHRTSMTG